MRPGFQLNCHNREKNPLFESHDPSMMWDPISETFYSYATDTAINSVYQQGIPVRKSKDLVNFTYEGIALSAKAIEEARDNGADYEPTGGFWAPYTEYDQGEYRMYYSATKAFGSSESRIWLAVADKPEGPFENRGVVADTWFTTDKEPNAIDPHIIHDEKGVRYLVYGSFFGGIYVKELLENGMPKTDAKDLGVCIAKKPKDSTIDGPEGAAVIYANGFYYLFFSYGWLGDDYDIRVARSRSVTGPYLDFDGKNVKEESLGMKLAGSYWFEAKKPYAVMETQENAENGKHSLLESVAGWSFAGFRGPGHGVPFYAPRYPGDQTDGYFFVHHIRDGAKVLCHEPKKQGEKASYIAHYMMVRQMAFLHGWPVFAPEPFAGEEKMQNSGILKDMLDEMGNDMTPEWILFDQHDNSQKKGIIGNVPKLLLDSEVVQGTFFDYENQGEVTAFTGYTEKGDCFWVKVRT